MPELSRTTLVPDATPADLWCWHLAPGTFQRLVPPWQRVELLRFPEPFEVGSAARLRVSQGPLTWTWNDTLTRVEPGVTFVDEARGGPFAQWRHEHRFEPAAGGCRVVDEVAWSLRGGALGELFAGPSVRRAVTDLLRHRHRRTLEDLRRIASWRRPTPLRVGLTGASGLVGTALTQVLSGAGHEVVPFVRPGSAATGVRWDPARGPDPADLVGLDAIVHLAGASIDEGPWTEARKQEIVASRVTGTRRLAEALAACPSPPPVFVSASAVGWWGDRRREVDEADAPGTGFLAETAQAWEDAAGPARAAGIRVVHPRVGLVVSAHGGMLPRLLPLARAGLLGPLGGGRQAVPWVALDDLVAMLVEAVLSSTWQGAFAAVAPRYVTQAELASTLGRVLCRPAFVPTPGFVLRLLQGEKGVALALEGAAVRPSRLLAWGFSWHRSDLEDALRYELGRLVREA